MKKNWIPAAMILAAFTISGLGTLSATAGGNMQAPEKEITISGKKPVKFSHNKHLELGLDCGTCHHNAAHEPLSADAIAALPSTDQLHCATCHNQDFANAKLQKRKDVFHARCKECHKEGVNGKKGPTKCSACHAKKKIEGC